MHKFKIILEFLNVPVLLAAKQPQTMMLPPLCFTFGTINLSKLPILPRKVFKYPARIMPKVADVYQKQLVGLYLATGHLTKY